MYMGDYGDTELEAPVKVLFAIKTNGKAFVDISKMSIYPEELEHKCTDKVRLKVMAVERMAGYFRIDLDEV